MIYEVKFPPGFDALDGVQPNPVPAADGRSYFTVYGKQDGTAAKAYMCRWAPDMLVAEFLTLEQYTAARGAPAVGPGGQHLWLWSFDTGKRLFVQIVPDWAPPAWMTPGADPRVDALVSQLGALSQQVTAIETALANASALDPEDREALDRLRRMIGL